jgi:hypothetical protein
MFGIGVGCLFICVGYFIVRKKSPLILIEDTLKDEHLERIRTLLLSHPEITFERLSLLAGSDTVTVRESIDHLVDEELLTHPIIVSEKGVARANIDYRKETKVSFE